jgi:hypothetical protein
MLRSSVEGFVVAVEATLEACEPRLITAEGISTFLPATKLEMLVPLDSTSRLIALSWRKDLGDAIAEPTARFRFGKGIWRKTPSSELSRGT